MEGAFDKKDNDHYVIKTSKILKSVTYLKSVRTHDMANKKRCISFCARIDILDQQFQAQN